MKLLCSIFNLLVLLNCTAVLSQDDDPLIKNKETTTSVDYIGIYQKYISGIRGQSCPMYPSCSRYGLDAFKNNNYFSAFLSLSDRLIRCGHDHQNYALTFTNDGFKILDIPEGSIKYNFSDLVFERKEEYFAYGDNIIDDSKLKFIKKLINEGYKREALLEIQRIEVFEGSLTKELLLNKISILGALGEYEKGIYEFEKSEAINIRKDSEILLQIAILYKKLDNIKTALNYVNEALTIKENSLLIRDELLKQQGVLFALDNNWDSSHSSFTKMVDIDKSEKLLNILETKNNIEFKNAKAAMFLSIIPGRDIIMSVTSKQHCLLF
ncbi:membrane protein insertion efficiency factor YidD [Flavobacteriaceae bacterium]|nr:membrane protein insertion efficiency factor YidD [Flavobacteriaceae bacterium]